MYEIDQTYLAYELAYRQERLTGRGGPDDHHHAIRSGQNPRRRRILRRGTVR
jgi:hypothetical protein